MVRMEFESVNLTLGPQIIFRNRRSCLWLLSGRSQNWPDLRSQITKKKSEIDRLWISTTSWIFERFNQLDKHCGLKLWLMRFHFFILSWHGVRNFVNLGSNKVPQDVSIKLLAGMLKTQMGQILPISVRVWKNVLFEQKSSKNTKE